MHTRSARHATSAPGLAHICAGTRPHLCRQKANKQVGQRAEFGRGKNVARAPGGGAVPEQMWQVPERRRLLAHCVRVRQSSA